MGKRSFSYNFICTHDSTFARYTGQNLICPSSAIVASLEKPPAKLKSKNTDLVINSNCQFCKRNYVNALSQWKKKKNMCGPLIISVLCSDNGLIMSRAVQKISFEFMWFSFLLAFGGTCFTFSKALACRQGSNHTCTYVTLTSRVIAYDVNSEKKCWMWFEISSWYCVS